MTAAAAAKLAAGVEGLQPLLGRYGFVCADVGVGPFAAAAFVRGDRELRLWLRGDSLSVSYRIGTLEIDHASFMRELLGPGGPNRFPTYDDDARPAFDALRHDLETHCGDFLDGAGDDLRRCAAAAAYDVRLSGAQRLARIERQLG